MHFLMQWGRKKNMKRVGLLHVVRFNFTYDVVRLVFEKKGSLNGVKKKLIEKSLNFLS
jgi:hypothetical protein